MIKHMRAM